MKVPVMVFEDGVLAKPGDFHRQGIIPSSVRIGPDLDLEFAWHQVWNHLGKTEAPGLGISTKTIDSLEVYDEALRFCATQAISGAVIFVDMSFNSLDTPLPLTSISGTPEILADKVQEFVSLCRELSPLVEESLDSALGFLSGNRRHGVLLAWVLVANPSLRDCDVWLASEEVTTSLVAARLSALAHLEARNVRVFDAAGTVARAGTELVAVRFRLALEKFGARYAGIAGRLWPEASKEWFAAEDPPIEMPHLYSQVTQETKTIYASQIGEYIRTLTGRETMPARWLNSEAFHETLKRLVGGDSGAHSAGKKIPALGSVLLLLAAAEKDAQCIPSPEHDWFLAVDFHAAALTGILPSSCNIRAIRDALLALHALFCKIVSPAAPALHKPEAVTNVAGVSWNTIGGILFLWIDFGIDSLVPAQGKDSGLLEKLFNRPWRSRYGGDVTEAYRAFRDAFRVGEETRLALTVYPIEVEGRRLTRFEFRAHT